MTVVVQRAVERITRALKKVAVNMNEMAQSISKFLSSIDYHKNPRVEHLSKHAKKYRTRKKNANRLLYPTKDWRR